MKPQIASQRLFVPAGFSGWWCERCDKAVAIDDTLGSPARCPKCHKPTAVWIPPVAPDLAVRELKAGAPYERTRPKDEDAKRLFDHVRHVIENPGLNPSLREIEDEQAKS